jgi:hypothetical protein
MTAVAASPTPRRGSGERLGRAISPPTPSSSSGAALTLLPSATPEAIAEHIAVRCGGALSDASSDSLGGRQSGGSGQPSRPPRVAVDAFAGCGGNAIQVGLFRPSPAAPRDAPLCPCPRGPSLPLQPLPLQPLPLPLPLPPPPLPLRPLPLPPFRRLYENALATAPLPPPRDALRLTDCIMRCDDAASSQ